MSACSYEVLHEWHSFMLERLQQQPPPGCAKPSIEQILRADRIAWVRLAERVHSLRRTASGALPLDAAIADLNKDPTVLFHLLPARETKAPERPQRDPSKKDDDKKRKIDEKKKATPASTKVQKSEMPDELKSIPNLLTVSESGMQGKQGVTLEWAIRWPTSTEVHQIVPDRRGSAEQSTVHADVRESPDRGDIRALFNMLPHETPPRGDGAGVLTAMVRKCAPSHSFTSLNLFFNVKTALHIDVNNEQLPNIIIGISDFRGGQVLVENPRGSHVISTATGGVRADLLEVAGTHAVFDAYRLRHETVDWTGDRLVLVAFSVKGSHLLCPDDRTELIEQGFVLPSMSECSTNDPPAKSLACDPSCLPLGLKDRCHDKCLGDMLFLEIFCGTGGLVIEWCQRAGILLVVENPMASKLWQG
ncbi:unnamed protein product, partial [Symbiodinium necroappetens]